ARNALPWNSGTQEETIGPSLGTLSGSRLPFGCADTRSTRGTTPRSRRVSGASSIQAARFLWVQYNLNNGSDPNELGPFLDTPLPAGVDLMQQTFVCPPLAKAVYP